LTKNLKAGILFLATIIAFMWFVFDSHQEQDKIILQQDLTTLSGTISNKLEIYKGSKGKNSLTLKLREYPNFDFVWYGVYLESLNSVDLINDAKIGDTATIKILLTDLVNKINKKGNLRISRQIINYSSIVPYDIQIHDKHYISLIDINNNLTAEATSIFWVGIVCITLLTIYLILDVTGTLTKFKNWFENLQASR
jgi:hypothetical protein